MLAVYERHNANKQPGLKLGSVTNTWA